ncbi:hypothetical protein NF867_17730 [Solitalea sp. MAHUQ-68]|uniref:Uncharacterized protein n=1 Tax=Solitalea agri TaxID=2953739 RepID=A0A9X2F4Q2_9SPHI|nr:hypothetical protein [Solitalea agri]MCO4294707.1 hypothetical protein [Solitalea agri]
MKRILLFIPILFFCSLSSVFAQKEAFIDTISQKICNELKDVQLDKLSPDSVTSLFGKVMMKACADHMGTLLEYYDLMGANSDVAAEQLGNDVAKNLMKNCPRFLDFALKMANEKKTPLPIDTESATSNYNGKLSKIVKGDFYKFICVNEQGLQETFYWLQHCGAEKLLPEPNKYIGKKVKINFIEVSYFIPAESNYKKIKMMVVFDLLN